MLPFGVDGSGVRLVESGSECPACVHRNDGPTAGGGSEKTIASDSVSYRSYDRSAMDEILKAMKHLKRLKAEMIGQLETLKQRRCGGRAQRWSDDDDEAWMAAQRERRYHRLQDMLSMVGDVERWEQQQGCGYAIDYFTIDMLDRLQSELQSALLIDARIDGLLGRPPQEPPQRRQRKSCCCRERSESAASVTLPVNCGEPVYRHLPVYIAYPSITRDCQDGGNPDYPNLPVYYYS